MAAACMCCTGGGGGVMCVGGWEGINKSTSMELFWFLVDVLCSSPKCILAHIEACQTSDPSTRRQPDPDHDKSINKICHKIWIMEIGCFWGRCCVALVAPAGSGSGGEADCFWAVLAARCWEAHPAGAQRGILKALGAPRATQRDDASLRLDFMQVWFCEVHN